MHTTARRCGVATLAATALVMLGLSGSGAATAARTPSPVTSDPSYSEHGGYGIGVDSRRGLVYMLDDGSGPGGVTVYHQATGTVTEAPVSGTDQAVSVAVDPVTGYAYLPSGNSSEVLTVMKAGRVVGDLTLPGSGHQDIAVVDPVRHIAYITGANDVYAVRGTTLLATIPVGAYPYAMTVNRATGVLYVPNYSDGTVSVIKDRRVVATIAVGGYPWQAAVDPLTGLVYVVNTDGNVYVLRGTRGSLVATIRAAASGNYGVAVDPIHHLAYVSNVSGNDVIVIRGTKVVSTLDVPTSVDQALSVNPATGVVLSTAGDTITALYRGRAIGSVANAPDDAELGTFDEANGRAFVSTDSQMLALQTPAVSHATLSSPRAGHSYRQGTRPRVRYACHAGVNNIVRRCAATRPNRSLVSTRRLGRHSFTVQVRSAYGPTVTRTIHYRVRSS